MDEYIACGCGCNGIMKVTHRGESDPTRRHGVLMVPHRQHWNVYREDGITGDLCRPATPEEIETFKIEYAKWRLNGGTNG